MEGLKRLKTAICDLNDEVDNQKKILDYILEYLSKNSKGRSLTQEEIDLLIKKEREKE